MKNSKLLKKGDIVIILSVVLVSAVWFMLTIFSAGEKQQVKIYLGGELYKAVSLSSAEKEEIISLDGCEIKITREGACFLSSDCPDGLCVKRGMMKNSGDVMACIPKGITLEITSADAVDGVSY